MIPDSNNFEIISTTASFDGLHRFLHEAMAATFEIFIQHKDMGYARQAAFAAFEELDKLEQQLSCFIENSDISQINDLSAGQSLRLGFNAFECLQLCSQIYKQTDCAFDITIGLLYGCWFDENKQLLKPSQSQLNFVSEHTGMQFLKLNEAEHTVQLLSEQVRIDLGGFGKGYAVDQMAQLLGEWSIDTALIHGGSSSVFALGCPCETTGWAVTLSDPYNHKQPLAKLNLNNQALSSSGIQKGRHIINSRTAQPVEGKSAAWACAGTAAESDALSTAFMVMGVDEIKQYCLDHPEVLAAIMPVPDHTVTAKNEFLHFGSWKKDDLFK